MGKIYFPGLGCDGWLGRPGQTRVLAARPSGLALAAVARPILFIGSKTGELSHLLDMHHAGYSVGIGESEVLAKTILEIGVHSF